MSLIAQDPAKPLLRYADQYELWKARTYAACWAASRLDVFTITDAQCIQLDKSFIESNKTEVKDGEAPGQKDGDSRKDLIGKCWTLILSSLHDELFLKLSHVQAGHIATLMAEIRSALLVNIAEDIQPLRLELYSATMSKDCNNDLQTYVSYIIQRRDKLSFLKIKIPDDEVAHIFLKGLPAVFQPLQVHYAIPGNSITSFDSLVDTTRKFASSPVVAAELAKLKSAGISQNVFNTTSYAINPNNKEKQYCFRFAKHGSCSSGDKCKFLHSSRPGDKPNVSSETTPARLNAQCRYCHYKGHTVEECRKLQSRNSKAALALATQDGPSSASPTPGSADVSDPFVFVFSIDNKDTQPRDWVLDSGATASATHNADDCVDIQPCHVNVTAAGCSFVVQQKGTAVIFAKDKSGQTKKILIKNCLISEKFPYKLLALQTFAKKGFSILMEGDGVSIFHPTSDLAMIARRDPASKLYFLTLGDPNACKNKEIALITPRAAAGAGKALIAKCYAGAVGGDLLWKLHLRHGHRNFQDICRQYSLPMPKDVPACTSCVMGKSHVYPHLSSGFTRATRPAEGFHSDFRGPFSQATPQGHWYLLTIIDDFSRRIFAFLVKSQSEWFEIWQKFVLRIESELGKQQCIAWLLSDNGAVYRSSIMTAFCAQRGIQQHFSAPYSQFLDHTAERNMRTIGEMMTTTLLHANMPKRAWGWASLHAADVINRTAESAISNKKAGTQANFSRLERWMGRALPNQTRGLYPFGCLAFKHVPGALRSKLDAHATPCVYLGIDASSKCYLLGSIYELGTSVSVEVTFFENVFPFRKLKQESFSSLLWDPTPALDAGDPRLGTYDTKTDPSKVSTLLDKGALVSVPPLPASGEPVASTPVISTESHPVSPTPREPEPVVPDIATAEAPVADAAPVALRRSTRTIIPRVQTNQFYREPKRTLIMTEGVEEHFSFNTVTEATLDTITPHNAGAAISSPQSTRWVEAMNREKLCHDKNGTFDYDSKPPDGVKPIPADWVFKIKHRGGAIDVEDLEDKQFKARVVIRGQFMKEGLDFNDTFAPVTKPTTLRAVLAVATKYSCLLFSGDVETAFLTAKMDCEVWVRMPPFWGPAGKPIVTTFTPPITCMLLKGVPGIPQGSRLFYETFALHLTTLGFEPAPADSCLFTAASVKERHAVLLWVDDFIFMCENSATFDWFMQGVRKKFNVPTCGPLTSFLGMNIVRDIPGRYLFFSQESSVRVLLERARMTDCNPTTVPCSPGAVFSKSDCPTDASSNRSTSEYRSIIAMANFISCWSRPDITFVVNKLCKFMSNPGEEHWKMLKHLLRYISGTKSHGVFYSFSSTSQLVHGYTDSSFADCPDTSRSTIAYVFFYGGAILSWYSKLNSYVTTSTNHSEYNALSAGAKEAEWFVSLFSTIAPEETIVPIPIMVDNSGIVSMVFNPVDHQSNKHVKVACHYTRELTAGRVIVPLRIPTTENIADVFTKPLSAALFSSFVSKFVAPLKQAAAMMLHVSADDSQPSSNFRRNWPFATAVKADLNADSFTVIDKGEKFASGRSKVQVHFHRRVAGKLQLLSVHDGMQLTSKNGNSYPVCRRVPRPDAAPASPEGLVLSSPRPVLTCLNCHCLSSVATCHIKCNSCESTRFAWSCGCIAPVAPDAPAPASPASPAEEMKDERPKRVPSLRSWVPKVRYQGPIRRGLPYHSLECSACPEANVICTIEFANVYALCPAQCCGEGDSFEGGC